MLPIVPVNHQEQKTVVMVDDDGDGFSRCADSDCSTDPACSSGGSRIVSQQPMMTVMVWQTVWILTVMVHQDMTHSTTSDSVSLAQKLPVPIRWIMMVTVISIVKILTCQ